jgi:putative hydrolase of the HAD superfamily
LTRRNEAGFAHVRDWVFDLDNTLYPRRCDLFGQIDLRMTDYVQRLTGLERDAARRLQKELYRDHGTTMNGLMHRYSIDPHEYLAHVHDIDYSVVPADPALGAAIRSLPGRKHVFTNGDVAHAQRALAALGIADAFDAMFDIVAAGFEPKPGRGAYERFLAAHGVTPGGAAMFEDLPRNLEPAKALGMVTVLVVPDDGPDPGSEAWEAHGADADHVDHVSDDLAAFLRAVNPESRA